MQRIEKIISKIEVGVAGAAFCVMVLMVAINVITRYIFGFSFPFSEEIAYLGFTYTTFFGICIVYKNKAMVTIDIVVNHLPDCIKYIFEIFIYTLLTVVNVLMIFYSLRLAISAYTKVTPYLRLSYTYIDIAAVMSFMLLTIYSVKFLFEAVKGQVKEDAFLEDRF
jgi:TRAP-type C4-dicarboxylate transport system permease small subunit